MSTFWTNAGSLVVNGSGEPILCASCPCETDAPCTCPYGGVGESSPPTTISLELTLRIYECSAGGWVALCTATDTITLTKAAGDDEACEWLNYTDTITCSSASWSNFSVSLDTVNCKWIVSIDSNCLAYGGTGEKGTGNTPYGIYVTNDTIPPAGAGTCGGPVCNSVLVSAEVS